MGYVLLYPKRSGVGGENPAEGQYWSEHLVPKMLKNGWSVTPDFTNEKVVSSMAEKAQTEIAAKMAVLDKRERDLVEREQALKSSKKAEV